MRRLTQDSLYGTLIFISQYLMMGLPNIEMVSLLLILYTKRFGLRALMPMTIFILLYGIFEGFHFGFWGYWLVWPILVFLTRLVRSSLGSNVWYWAIFSACYGGLFGLIFAWIYGWTIGMSYALSYWLNGIPYDISHMVGNYLLMLLLGTWLEKLLKQVTI